MKKNINKFIAFGIGLSVIVGNVSPVLANDVVKDSTRSTISGASESELKVLTLDKAMEEAINKDENIKKYTVQMNYYKNYEDYLNETDASDYEEESNDLEYNSAKQSREFQKDKVEYNISQLFNNIIVGEEEIDVLQQSINVQSKKLEETKLKYQKGLITSVDLISAENELNSTKSALTNKKNILNDNKENLALLTGINIKDYAFDDSLKYNVYRINGDINNYIDDKIDTYLKYSQEKVDLLKDNVDDLKDDDYDEIPSKPKKDDYYTSVVDPETGKESEKLDDDEYNSAINKYNTTLKLYSTYLQFEMNSQTTDLALQRSRKDLNNSIRALYTSLIDLEQQISNTKADVELANKKLANTKLQYQLGLMTASDYNGAVAQAKASDVKLRTLVNNYNNMVIAIEKPWAMF